MASTSCHSLSRCPRRSDPKTAAPGHGKNRSWPGMQPSQLRWNRSQSLLVKRRLVIMANLCAVQSGSVASVDLSHLPDWLLASVDSCPSAGSGVHFWLFRISRQLLVHMNEEEIFALLKSKAAGCGRPV